MEKVATMNGGRGLRAWRADLLGAIALGAAYYLAAQLSLQLALVGENITPLWPPTGIALVGFLLRGRRLWPGVAIAAFAVNLTISATPLAAATTAAGNTLAPLAAAILLDRVGFRPQLDRLRKRSRSSWGRNPTPIEQDGGRQRSERVPPPWWRPPTGGVVVRVTANAAIATPGAASPGGGTPQARSPSAATTG